MKEVFNIVSRGEYPGRGIIMGQAPDGRLAAIYFIMGRSQNSRNRIFMKEADGLRTRAYRASELKDPSLVIYRAAAEHEGKVIVTNGDQTDTVVSALARGGDFISALMTREFEPDMPNCTPRISAMYNGGTLSFSILKCENERGEGCLRQFFTYPLPEAGAGYFISTYSGLRPSGALKPYEGEPEKAGLPLTGEALARKIWTSLNEANRVALYARFWREGERAEEIIINKLEEVK